MTEPVSKSSARVREIIEKAIKGQEITRDEYEKILNIVTEDGYIDRQEQTLLTELQRMIGEKEVRFVN